MIKLWPAKLAIALLIIAILPLSYPLYYLGKIPVCLAAIYYCYNSYKRGKDQDKRFWIFLAIAIAFNPLIPLHLFFSILWIIVDIATAIYFYKFIKVASAKHIQDNISIQL